jgi:hypothetical protein
MKTRFITLSSFICLLSLMEPPGGAAEVMVSTNRTTQTIITTADSGALPLNNAGTTTWSGIFSGSKYLIHFHAEWRYNQKVWKSGAGGVSSRVT